MNRKHRPRAPSRDPLNSPPPQLELAGLMTADPLTLIEHVDAEGMPPGHLWPKLLANLHDVVMALLARDTRLSEVERMDLGRDLLIAITGYFGGRMIYLPCGETLLTAIRDRQMWARYLHGAHIDDLARETGMTDRRVWQVLKEQRALFERRMQGRLFADDEPAQIPNTNPSEVAA
jgi:Mor family transcriptional regulator